MNLGVNINIKLSNLKSKLGYYLKNPRKTPKRLLVLGLLIGIILEITYLFWYYRDPLVQNFFVEKPKSHSVISFRPKKVRIVKQADVLTGKGLPDSVVVLYLTPGKYRSELKTNQKGQWFYKIPSDIDLRKYRVTLQYLDKGEKIVAVKKYKIRVARNNVFSTFTRKLFQKLNIKQTIAQELEQTGEAAIIAASGEAVAGSLFPGGKINVQAITNLDDPGLAKTWYIQDLDFNLTEILPDPNCIKDCDNLKILPKNLKNGEYDLRVNFYQVDQNQVKTLVTFDLIPIFISSNSSQDEELIRLEENDLESPSQIDEVPQNPVCETDEFREKINGCEENSQGYNVWKRSIETGCEYIPTYQLSEEKCSLP